MPVPIPLLRSTGLVRRGLVAEYRFNEGQGQILHDYSGNGNHGQLGSTAGADINDPTWTPRGLSLTTDDYATVGAITGGGITQSAYCVSIVFYNGTEITRNSTLSPMFGLKASPDTQNYGFISFGGTSTVLTSEIITILSVVAGTQYATGWCSAADVIKVGWHILTINWNGSSYDIWLDGIQKTATGGTSGHCGLIPLSGVIFGTSFYNNGVSTYFFTGSIATCPIYSTSLTTSELIRNNNYLRSHLAPRGITI